MATKTKITYPKRGEIYLVSFDPALGAEIQKTRPALVLQNNIANRHSPLTIVAAITSKFSEEPYPVDVLIETPEGGLAMNSVVMLDQVRTMDKERLVKRLGQVSPETMSRVDRALMISLGLVKI
jgi:mRNA interferase MazF